MMISLAEVRDKIDEVDRQIIELLAQRARFVQRIGELKKNDGEIVAPDRQIVVFESRRAWAEEFGVDPDFVENLYREMISYFIETQREQHKNRNE